MIYDFVTEQREFFDLERDPHETRNLSPSGTDEEEVFAAAVSRFTTQRLRAGRPPIGKELDEDLSERLRALGYLE